MRNHLDELNAAQREAAVRTEGPLLVLAGAGAGKTRVIAHRILELARRGVPPSEILAVTFTNKAAREMRERIRMLLEREGPALRGPLEAEPFVATFHSLGLFIIKENYRALGFSRFPAVFDRADSLRAMKLSLKELGTSEELEARAALATLSRAKGEGLLVGEYAESAHTPRERLIALAWERYERALAREQALDFDDLLARAVRLLRGDERAKERYRARWRYLHIDEYQDTNGIQAELVELLTGKERNVCAVGDIDQTIYTWRGAQIANILAFDKTFPGTKVIVLEENYRSTKTILAAANDIIRRNAARIEKNMFTKNAEGKRLSLYQATDETDEALYVVRAIQGLLRDGSRPRDIAVLYRANFQSRALEEALLAAGIPHQVLGTRFFERAEVKDALSYLRAALLGTSADIARIANTPRRGIGKTTLLALLMGEEGRLSSALQAKVADFKKLLRRIADACKMLAPSQAAAFAVRESGMERQLKEDKMEGAERLENLRELVSLASRFDALPLHEGLSAFLESAALASEQDELKEEADAVRLMTVHASKGLEFPHVFITGLEDGLFPFHNENNDERRDKEEERRLMYVAITRAQSKVHLSYAMSRAFFGARSLAPPSRFLADIPQELIELEALEHPEKTIRF